MKVAFYKAKTRLFNRLVSWYDKSPYSHCEIVLDTETSLCGSSSFRDGGVRMKVIDLDPQHWDILDIELSSQDQILVKAWFELHSGQGYDTLGLLGFLFRREQGNKSKWFCSEAIAASLGYSEPFRFDPATLYSVLKGKR
jgi:hypothetical protein